MCLFQYGLRRVVQGSDGGETSEIRPAAHMPTISEAGLSSVEYTVEPPNNGMSPFVHYSEVSLTQRFFHN